MSDGAKESDKMAGAKSALSDCFEHGELRGRDLTQIFNPTERRLVVAALRASPPAAPAGGERTARVPKVRTNHGRNAEEAARLQKLVDERFAPAQSNGDAELSPADFSELLTDLADLNADERSEEALREADKRITSLRSQLERMRTALEEVRDEVKLRIPRRLSAHNYVTSELDKIIAALKDQP